MSLRTTFIPSSKSERYPCSTAEPMEWSLMLCSFGFIVFAVGPTLPLRLVGDLTLHAQVVQASPLPRQHGGGGANAHRVSMLLV